MTDEEAKLLDAVDEHFEELICGDTIEPKIVLSLNEAKDLLSWLRNSQWKHKHQCNFEFAEDWRKDMFDCLNERIEQAEMSMQSTQCENVSKKDEKIITLSVKQAEGK